MFDMVRKIVRHFRDVIRDGGNCVCTTHMDDAVAKALQSAEQQKAAALALLNQLQPPAIVLEDIRSKRRALHHHH